MRILTTNSGSSSVKVGLYEMGEAEKLVLFGSMEQSQEVPWRAPISSLNILITSGDWHLGLGQHGSGR